MRRTAAVLLLALTPAFAADTGDLRTAVRAGDAARVRELIKHGTPVNGFDSLGGTALHDAVWAGEEARLFFYDSTGARFAEVRLSEAPDPQQLSGARQAA